MAFDLVGILPTAVITDLISQYDFVHYPATMSTDTTGLEYAVYSAGSSFKGIMEVYRVTPGVPSPMPQQVTWRMYTVYADLEVNDKILYDGSYYVVQKVIDLIAAYEVGLVEAVD